MPPPADSLLGGVHALATAFDRAAASASSTGLDTLAQRCAALIIALDGDYSSPALAPAVHTLARSLADALQRMRRALAQSEAQSAAESAVSLPHIQQLQQAAAACAEALALAGACACAACGQLLAGEELALLGEHRFHISCFTCQACGAALRDTGRLQLLPALAGLRCMKCAPPCAGCGSQLDQRYVACLERAYHPQCLRCTTCKRQLLTTADGPPRKTVYARSGQPVCGRCVQPVFSSRFAKLQMARATGGAAGNAADPEPEPEKLSTIALDAVYETPQLLPSSSRRLTVYGAADSVTDDASGSLTPVYARPDDLAGMPRPVSMIEPAEAEEEEDSEEGEEEEEEAVEEEGGDNEPSGDGHYQRRGLFPGRRRFGDKLSHTASVASTHSYAAIDSGASSTSSRMLLAEIADDPAECARLLEFAASQPGFLEPLLLWMDLEQFAALPASTSADEVARCARAIVRKYVNSSGDLPVALAWHVRQRAAASSRRASTDTASEPDYETPVLAGDGRQETRELIMDFAEMRFAVRRRLERQLVPAFAEFVEKLERVGKAGQNAAATAAGTATAGVSTANDAAASDTQTASAAPVAPPRTRGRKDSPERAAVSSKPTMTTSATPAPVSTSSTTTRTNSTPQLLPVVRAAAGSLPLSVAVEAVETRTGFEWRRPYQRQYAVYVIRVEVETAASKAGSGMALPSGSYRIYRRYRECRALQELIAARRQHLALPHFPGKFEHSARGKTSLRSFRKSELQQYLAAVARLPECWSMPAVRDFFQARLDDRVWVRK